MCFYRGVRRSLIQALADCQSRGQRLANIYNENEQTELNALIADIGGSDRAFWLGMIEDGETPDKFGIKVKFFRFIAYM